MRQRLEPLTPQTRRWRTGLLVACALVAISNLYVIFECSPIMPWCSTTMGFAVDWFPSAAPLVWVVTATDKGGRAEKAGLRAGDRIEFRDIPFRERWRLRDVMRTGWSGLIGEQLRYVVHQGAHKSVVVLRPRPTAATWPTIDGWLAIAGALWAVLFAAIIVARRPDLVEARLLALILLFAIGVNVLTGFVTPWPVVELLIQGISAALFFGVPPILLTILVLRLGPPPSIGRRLLALISFAAAAVATAVVLAMYFLDFTLGVAAVSLQLIGFAVALALLTSLAYGIATSLAARGAERARLFIIVGSITPVWLLYTLLNLGPVLSPWLGSMLSGVPYWIIAVCIVSLPIGLTYGILSRRIVDLGYLINRATVFTILSLIIVGTFMLAEWLMGNWLASQSHVTNLAINAALVVGLGFSSRAIHRRIERFVDEVFFRKRYEGQQAILEFAREAAFATDSTSLVNAAIALLKLRADATDVSIVLDGGRGCYGDVGENDPAVLALRARHRPVDLHEVQSAFHGEYAYPMAVAGRLVGVLILGPKRSGEAYAPDESRAIAQLATALGGTVAVHALASENKNLPEAIAQRLGRLGAQG